VTEQLDIGAVDELERELAEDAAELDRAAVDPYAAIPAINWSTLKYLDVSPRMLRWRVEHPRHDTDALDLGRAIHCAILEPERFASEYIAEPDFGDLRTNTAKAQRAAWLASIAPPGFVARPYFDTRLKAGKEGLARFAIESVGSKVLVGNERAADVLGPGVETLPIDEYELAVRCAESARAHPAAARLLTGGRREEIVTWTDEATGVACKARLDFITPMYVLDLKSTRRSTLRQMWADFASYLHHGQLAMYHDGAIASRRLPHDAERPRVLFVQTTEPYDVVPAQLTAEDLETGRELYRSLLRKYVACQAADWFPGLASDVVDSALPPWAARGAREEEQNW
jgi:hypothetical protein